MGSTVKRIAIPDSVIKIWKSMNDADKAKVAEEARQHMIDRAQIKKKGFNESTGRDKKFVRYSDGYAKKKGVSPSNVDLTLDDKMLKAMETVAIKPASFSVGYSGSNSQKDKAEGNIRGTYGQSRGSSSKARPFLGLQKSDLERIIRGVNSEPDQQEVSEDQ